MEELVSVIVPTYNRASLLYECIDSVNKQTYRPIELLVVDDGSSDGTADILADCIAKLSRFDFNILYFQQERKGAPAARNKGFLESKGDYVQFLDSDDLLLPHKLEQEIKFMREKKYDLVYSKAQFVDEKLRPIKGKLWGRALTGTEFDYFTLSWQTMCALYKRSAILREGLWLEHLTINQDWEFSIRYILADLKIGFIDSYNSLFRVHPLDRIGNNLYLLEKIEGKEISTKIIRGNVIKRNKLTPQLDLLFFKRLIYCALSYGSVKADMHKKRVLLFVFRNFKNLSINQKLLLFSLRFTNNWFDKSLLFCYLRFIS